MIIGICLSDDDNCVYLVSMMCLDLYVYLYTAYSFVVANVCVLCVYWCCSVAVAGWCVSVAVAATVSSIKSSKMSTCTQKFTSCCY